MNIYSHWFPRVATEKMIYLALRSLYPRQTARLGECTHPWRTSFGILPNEPFAAQDAANSTLEACGPQRGVAKLLVLPAVRDVEPLEGPSPPRLTMRSTFFAKAATNAFLMANTESVLHDDLVVCACAGQEFKARDAMEAALFCGHLNDLWQSFLRRVAAEKQADEADMELDEDAIDAAAEQFRYDHDLITAEETEQWLTMRGLTLDNFGGYFARQTCLHALGDDVTPEEIDYLSAPDDLRQLFAVELILSGDLDRITTDLSWRLAAAAATANEEADAERIKAERTSFFERAGLAEDDLTGWLQKMGREATWFEQMVRMESEYRRRSESLLTPQMRQRERSVQRLGLTRFEAEVIELESRDAAQEALFCVKEDGMSMQEVATEGRYPYKVLSFLQEDIPDDLQQRFLSVTVGEVLEPLTRGDGFELYRITSKKEPQADDPAVQERIDHVLLYRHFSELAARYIEPRLHGGSVQG